MGKSGYSRIFNVAHTEAESLTLGEAIQIAFETFLEDPSFKARRILKPLFTDQSSFDSLVKGVVAFGGNVLSQAISSIAPFGRQLFIYKSVRNEKLRAAWSGYRAPDPRALMRNACENLVATKFGKQEVKPATKQDERGPT